jgi:hypothetical protein
MQEIQVIMNPPHLEQWNIERTDDGFAILSCDSESHWPRQHSYQMYITHMGLTSPGHVG